MRRPAVVLAALIAACSAPASQPATPSDAATQSPSTTAPAIPSRAPTTPTGIPYPTVSAISAPSATLVWVVTDGARLFRSSDRGNTWEERAMPLHNSIGRDSISFVDDREGWFLNGFVPGTQCQQQAFELWHTADAAESWVRLVRVGPGPGANGISFGQCKGALSFVDPRRGVLSAMDTTTPPTIYRTSDGGQAWTGTRIADPPGFATSGGGNALQPGRARWFGSTILFDARTWSEGRSIRHVFCSSDAGASWVQVRMLVDVPEPIVFVTPTRWLRFAWPAPLETTDAGATWHAYATDYLQGAAPVPPTVVFADASVGYAAVRFSIQRTIDGGAHWTPLRMPGI